MPFVQTNPIQMRDNTANALVVREKVGGINYVEIDTLDGSEVIRLLPTGIGDIRCFVNSAEGITRYLGISGYKTSGSLAEARLGVGVHTDQVLSFYNVAGYYFDNNVTISKTTIEDWLSSMAVVQIGGSSAILADTTEGAGKQLLLAQNSYYDSGSAWKYVSTDEASLYRQFAGAHKFFVAASGTADTAISWTSAAEITITGLGLGVTPAQKFEIGSNDNSKRVSYYHNNTDAYISQSGGDVYFLNTETDTDNTIHIQGNGTGIGVLELYDAANTGRLEMYVISGVGFISTAGAAQGDLEFQYFAENNVSCFSNAAEGETRYFGVSGRRTGGTKDEMQFAVGVHADQVGSIYGAAGGYAFDTSVYIKEQAAALTDIPGYGQTWVESTTPNRYMFRDDAGIASVLNEVKGSFTMGTTGFGTPPSDTAYYTIRGNIVTLRIPAFSATSNSTDFTLTGLPAAIQPSIGGRLFIGVVDNGTPTYGKALFAASGTIQLAKESGNFGSGWTASGTKGTNGEFFVTYELAV